MSGVQGPAAAPAAAPVALVTGASRGIGRAVAEGLARAGYRVLATARDEGALQALAGSTSARWLAADLARPGTAERLAAWAAAEGQGALDALVLNAGILGPRAPLASVDAAAWREVIEVNLTAPFLLARACFPLLAEAARRRPERGASAILLTSGVGRRGRANWGPYAVSKFGIEGLTQVLAEEWLPHRIRVNAVNPGGTRTAMRAAAYPEEDPLTLPAPEEHLPLFLYLAGPESRGVTGRSIDARGWRPPCGIT